MGKIQLMVHRVASKENLLDLRNQEKGHQSCTRVICICSQEVGHQRARTGQMLTLQDED